MIRRLFIIVFFNVIKNIFFFIYKVCSWDYNVIDWRLLFGENEMEIIFV